ncbi:hypothetical protein AB0M20_01785 [Actinoplanes sp. NPDC051633]|uniref:hypothetical protein n=1 Tax=Actinoplanes sp. NPDC051633 TaxID=3155670 RepID=UPI00342B7954
MSNWITAAGLALIAGGVAVLIGFRHVLLGGDLAGEGAGELECGGVRRRRPATADFSAPGQMRARRRRSALATVPAAAGPIAPRIAPAEDAEQDSGLIALGLAGEEEPPADEKPPSVEAVGEEIEKPTTGPVVEPAVEPVANDEAGDRFALADEPATGTLQALGVELRAMPEPAPRIRREGDRVQGWVRPEYDDDPAPGEYWTPIPETMSSYGWPIPVERLPEVPPYPPQSGFDIAPYDQDVDAMDGPTKLVPQWPPAKPSGRIELPRSWQARNAQGRDPQGRIAQSRSAEDAEPADRPRRRSPVRRRVPAPDAPAPAAGEADQARRPRPRPRPAPAERSTVYRSRHAADPG